MMGVKLLMLLSKYHVSTFDFISLCSYFIPRIVSAYEEAPEADDGASKSDE